MRSLTARTVAVRLVAALDLIALAALASTLEVHWAVFAAAGVAFAASRTLPAERGAAATPAGAGLAWGFAALFLGTAAAWISLRTAPIVLAAHAAPLAHSLLWFRGRGSEYRGWRMAMGFVELVLAAVITTDIFLPFAIVLFTVLTSVAASCNFLDSELAQQSPSHREDPLPPGFVARSLAYAVVAFFSSALIFPLLPRTNEGGALGAWLAPATVGYVENVSVGQWHLLQNDRSGKTMLRIYSPANDDPSFDIYLGLLRGRVLERFDGKNWNPARRELIPQAPVARDKARGGPASLEIVRESLGSSEVLPLPYGTIETEVETADGRRPARPLRSGEWIDPGSGEARVRYFVSLRPNDLGYLRNWRDADRPRPELHLDVPTVARTERMERLARTLFGGLPRESAEPDAASVAAEARIAAVRDYYRRERFSEPAADTVFDRPLPARSPLSPLEEFLFVTKEGHCEWFATATAVLLRMGGVPTRLVAGFRLSRGPIGGVLSVRSSEAHAWLEAWVPNRGWIPVDPTPRVYVPSSVTERFRDAYDLLSGYWFRYVVSYDRSSGADERPGGGSSALTRPWDRLTTEKIAGLGGYLVAHREAIGAAVIGTLAGLLGIALALWRWYPQVFSIRWKVQDGPAALRQRRVRMEKLLDRAAGVPRGAATSTITDPQGEARLAEISRRYGVGAADAARAWTAAYLRARFGAGDGEGVAQLRRLDELYRNVRIRVAARNAGVDTGVDQKTAS